MPQPQLSSPGVGAVLGWTLQFLDCPLISRLLPIYQKRLQKKVRRVVKRREKARRGQKGQQAEDRVKETISSPFG